VNVKYIENAEEMYDAVLEEFPSADIVIKSAAVADYRPKQVSNEKMKKQDGDLIIQMERTKDILKTLGERKDHQFLVGFAAETSNLDEYAMSKLKRKNADMIIANNVNEKGAGFEEDTNIVTIYKKDGSNKRLGLMSKKELAKEIFREIVKTLQEERSK
jgi:phosphopantothenoylcysteine decarboxylase/phosphopantothenate--cysteine ligase